MKKICLAVLLCLTACAKNEHTLKVAASSTPHAQILNSVKEDLKKEGVDLKVITIDDYNLPNRSLAEKDVDANFFQHIPFLDNQIAQFDYCLTPIAKIHIEPMRIYSKTLKTLNDLADNAKVAIPNDPTNEARALQLLEQKGLIDLKAGVGEQATVKDIEKNPKHLEFLEIDAALLPRTLEDVSIAIIPANYALQAGLSPEKQSLGEEDSSSPYANVLVVRCGDENREDIQKLKAALNSEKTREYILQHFHGAIVPAF